MNENKMVDVFELRFELFEHAGAGQRLVETCASFEKAVVAFNEVCALPNCCAAGIYKNGERIQGPY